MTISENLETLKSQLPAQVKLIPISKRQPKELIEKAYNGGQRIFGENRAQDLKDRHEIFPKDIVWHFVGHLQRNKVKYIAPYVQYIHSVDSLKLLKKINKEAEKNERTIDCLLQFHIADEESKFGFSPEKAEELVKSEAYKEMKNIRLTGVMAMATNTDDKEKVRNEFKRLKTYFDQLKSKYFSESNHFKEISAGMSGDYKIAVEEGSTMVRLGSLIFGERKY
ncbi:MAG: YggS family pyridoxal phosphate-dependent enzyme [Bacteroidota bacterium]|nr:YggS family pyridoxal phosphate-dependent enzyme [Bacteroidota bacterium]